MKNRKISNIKNYQLVNGKLFLSNDQREVFNEDKSTLLNQFHFDVSCLMSIGDFLIIPISENLGNTFVFNSVSNYGYKLKEGCPFKRLNDTVIELQELDSDLTSFYFKLYDLIKQKYIFEPSLKFRDINHLISVKTNLFFSGSNDIINSFHLPTETTLWQYSVADIGAEKVSKILGVFGETLVVVCGYSKNIENPYGQKVNAKLEKIIGLDVNTGHLLYETNQYVIDEDPVFLGSGLNTNWVFNEGETLIHAILDDYMCFDTQSGKITALNIGEMAQEKGINGLQSSSIEGNKLGFRAFDDQLGGFQSVVGIFNTLSLKIEDHHTYADARKEGAFFKPGQPIVSGNKIYALDSKNTLHISERE